MMNYGRCCNARPSSIVSCAIVLAALLSSLAMAEEAPIRITLMPDVQKEISLFPPEEKTRIEQAINVGNQFGQLFFDGTATAFDPDDREAWSKIGPLVAVGDEEWSNRSRLKAKEFKVGESMLDGGLEVCPHIVLFSIQRQPEHLVLSYRATVMGIVSDHYLYTSKRLGNGFYTEGQEASYEVGFELDARNRVTRFMAQDNTHASVYTRTTAWMEKLVRNPEHRLRRFGDTDATVKSKVEYYKKAIREIEYQAAQICK